MTWLTALALLFFAGIAIWLLVNKEARVLMRELGRFGLYRIALAIQNLTGRPSGYVVRYRESVARDAGLKKSDGESSPHDS